MASLREYFNDDAKHNLTTQAEWELKDATGNPFGAVVARLHLDFDAGALYVSFFVPAVDGPNWVEDQLLDEVTKVLAFRDGLDVQAGFPNHMQKSSDLIFTGQVYLYSERSVPSAVKVALTAKGTAQGYRIAFRGSEYMDFRNHAERPKAFISHDSRDKVSIAQPLATRLSQMMTPVWYDEYSVRVGDSLRESIERGLKECPKCILILTPNFLANLGWSKREYDTIFTREVVEKTNVILPIWHDVSVADVFSYSPILADKLAVNWSEGVDAVARKLVVAMG